MPDWTKEMDYALAFGTALGLSARQLAGRIPGKSRNSIIGRWHRTGLSVPNKQGGQFKIRQGVSMPKDNFYIHDNSAVEVVPLPRGPRKFFTEEKIEKLKEMFREGKADEEIGEALGHPASTIYSKRMQLRLLHRPPSSVTRKSWTPEEDATLRRMFIEERKPITTCAAALGRLPKTCHDRAYNLGLKRPRSNRPWTKEDNDLLKQEWAAFTPTEIIAEKLKRGIPTVRMRVHQLGLHRDGRKTKLLKRFGADALAISDDPQTVRKHFADLAQQEADAAKAEFQAKVKQALDVMDHALANGGDRKTEMRAALTAGATLGQIGDRQGITRERVRQIVYKTTNTYIPRSEEERTTCQVCGEKYEPTWISSKYCSDRCRAEARTGYLHYTPAEPETVNCAKCDKPFVRKHKMRKYCSDICSVQAAVAANRARMAKARAKKVARPVKVNDIIEALPPKQKAKVKSRAKQLLREERPHVSLRRYRYE